MGGTRERTFSDYLPAHRYFCVWGPLRRAAVFRCPAVPPVSHSRYPWGTIPSR